jgi:arsenite methyltransferase
VRLWHALRRRVKALLISAPGRDGWQQPDAVIAALRLAPGRQVADIGAGSGYFTFRLATAVAPGGRVYAVDPDDDMLDIVREQAATAASEVVAIRATDDDPALPNPVDLAFISHTFHHLQQPAAYLARLRTSLSSGGRVVVLEPKPRGGLGRILGHTTPPDRIRAEMSAAGYDLAADHDFLPDESMLEFVPASATRSPAADRPDGDPTV